MNIIFIIIFLFPFALLLASVIIGDINVKVAKFEQYNGLDYKLNDDEPEYDEIKYKTFENLMRERTKRENKKNKSNNDDNDDIIKSFDDNIKQL